MLNKLNALVTVLVCSTLFGCAGTKLHKFLFAYRNPNHWVNQYCQSPLVKPHIPPTPVSDADANNLEAAALKGTQSYIIWLIIGRSPQAQRSRNALGEDQAASQTLDQEGAYYAIMLYLANHDDPQVQLHLADFYAREYVQGIPNMIMSDQDVQPDLRKDVAQAAAHWAVIAAASHASEAVCDYDLGQFYSQAVEVADDATAMYWYRLSGQQGYAAAQVILGEVYSKGVIGVTADPTQAYYWYHLAAQQGVAEGEYAMAADYRYGRGTSPDAVKSAYWLGRAVAAGYQPAMYLNEHILLKPLVTAAETTGNATTEYQLACAYFNGSYQGQKLPVRQHKAAYWFSKCAPAGNAEAECYLGYCYQNGFGTAANPTLAAYWYQLSAKQGNSVAENDIGTMYEAGDYFTQSDTKAATCYMVAAHEGYAQAKTNLKSLLQKEIVQSPDPSQFIQQMRETKIGGVSVAAWDAGQYGIIMNKWLQDAKAEHQQWVQQQQQQQEEEQQQEAQQQQEEAQQQQDDANQPEEDQPADEPPPEPDPGE